MPYAAPERRPTRRDHLRRCLCAVAILAFFTMMAHAHIEHLRETGYRSLYQDGCHCLGCGS